MIAITEADFREIEKRIRPHMNRWDDSRCWDHNTNSPWLEFLFSIGPSLREFIDVNIESLILTEASASEFDKQYYIETNARIAAEFVRIRKDIRKLSYRQYLLTRHWKRVRKCTIRNCDGHCMICGMSEALNVHHNSYANLGDEFETDVVLLCERCHRKVHDRK